MKTLTKTIAFAIIATGLTGASAFAVDVTQRGPLPFAAWDMNNDGSISDEEFISIRGKRQAARAAEGRMMRNMDSSPDFESFDTNGDEKISKEEFTTRYTALMQERPRGPRMGQGRGMGRGWGMGGRGRGRMMNQ